MVVVDTVAMWLFVAYVASLIIRGKRSMREWLEKQ